MSTTREMWEWGNEGSGKLGGFQAKNFGRTLFVLFRLLPSVLGGRGYGRSGRKKR